MRIMFRGGPLDGETRDVASSPQPDRPLYWSITQDAEVGAATRHPEVAEYLYRGDGTADYVAGGRPASSLRPDLI